MDQKLSRERAFILVFQLVIVSYSGQRKVLSRLDYLDVRVQVLWPVHIRTGSRAPLRRLIVAEWSLAAGTGP